MSCSGNCFSCSPENKNKYFQNVKNRFQAENLSNFTYNFDVYSRPSSMLLGLTDNCNLACSYCFVKQKPLEMTYEIAEKSIEWLLNNHSNDSTPLVTFFGGEPLLKYSDIIVPIVEKYKEKVNFSITTNGTLLDEDKVDFFYKNNVGILLSFDGIKEVQNTQRAGKEINSFEAVRDNIPYLLLRFPNTTMRMTLTKLAIPHLYDTILLAEEFGFKNITFCPNAYEDWDWDDAVAYEEQLEKIGLHIFKSFYNNNDIAIRVNPLIDYFNNIELGIQGNLHYNNSLMRCGLGTTSCAITPEGQIIPCQEKISCPTWVIGNVFEGIDPKAHETFLKWYINKMNNDFICNRKCVTLKENVHCLNNTCPSRLEDLNFKPSTATCVFNRVTLRIAHRLYLNCQHSIDPKIVDYFSKEEVY